MILFANMLYAFYRGVAGSLPFFKKPGSYYYRTVSQVADKYAILGKLNSDEKHLRRLFSNILMAFFHAFAEQVTRPERLIFPGYTRDHPQI